MAGEILEYHPTSKMAEAVRRMAKWGLNVADYVPGPDGTSPYREDTRYGFGNAETVASWIGTKFANLSEAKTAYPIIQSTSDTIDWVLLQTAIDDAIYGALGNANKGNTNRVLKISAGYYVCNRPLHLGYGNQAGTPPGNLNGNGYVSITLEGEGANVDGSGNGMNGVTIRFTSSCGIVGHGYQRTMVRGIAILGPWLNWYANNLFTILFGDSPWDRNSWKPTGIDDDEWLGGAAVGIGIGVDLYTSGTSAAAYPARALPALFGGGTTTEAFTTGPGGTGFICEDVIISGFPIGFGRPHGDANGEFLEFNGGIITYCPHPFVFGHSQARNNNIRNVNAFGFHTFLGSRGGTRSNANIHGGYYNIHAAYGYQMLDHPNAGWSGVLTIRDLYMEGVLSIGRWQGLVRLDGCYFSFWEIDGVFGVAPRHADISYLVLDGCTLTGLRHGLNTFTGNISGAKLEVVNGTAITSGWNTNYASHENAALIGLGQGYMNSILHMPGWNSRRGMSNIGQGRYGTHFDQGTYTDNNGMTSIDQEWVEWNGAGHPFVYSHAGTLSPNRQGAIQRFPVPKISKYQDIVGLISRSGFDLTCDRSAFGDIKADVGDMFALFPEGADATLKVWTWFVVVSVTTGQMVLRQQTNYSGDSLYDYKSNGMVQIVPETGEGCGFAPAPYANFSEYICTRIRYNKILWTGDVTSGSNVITNIKNSMTYGSVDDFDDANCQMEVGDFFLHHEIERGNTGGSGLKTPNKITAIDFTANTITLTDNFNITRTNYPLPFFVESYTA